ncbi:MAG: alpha/beta fold hydrolase [Oscillatoriophycideae cyanobacterium NC_groundwater_1537_Pr4_S-0.65um_50_18]|nr:alpha/beta fold hydrolase [Oscillatoriophycideae cyanobacterium NC_groundwater_1537_Pr4_S-0.65um_50_18]
MATQEHTIEVGELKWFYRAAEPMNPSAKSPVLLLHGLPCQSYGWRHVLPALAGHGFRAIAPDWIGCGASAKPDKRNFAYSPEAYITALAAFVTALGLEKFSLVVQGFLGSVGLQYALRHPEQIDRLAILNAPLSPAAKLPWKMRQMGVPLVGEMLTQDPLLTERTLEGGGGYVISEADLDVYRRPFLKSSEAGRALLAIVKNLQLPEATAEIQAGFAQWQKPTLLLWGTRDPWLPYSLAENFAAPDKELTPLNEAGHYPQEDRDEQVSMALSDFLRRQVL